MRALLMFMLRHCRANASVFMTYESYLTVKKLAGSQVSTNNQRIVSSDREKKRREFNESEDYKNIPTNIE